MFFILEKERPGAGHQVVGPQERKKSGPSHCKVRLCKGGAVCL